MQKNKYSKLKIFGLYTLSVIVNLLPLIIVLIINWNICTKTKREGIALSVTGIIWVAILIISLIGFLPKKINRIFGLGIFFVVVMLMKPLLQYMGLFVGAALIGALLDEIIIRPIIKRYEELRLATKTAEITTQHVKKIIEQERSGRV